MCRTPRRVLPLSFSLSYSYSLSHPLSLSFSLTHKHAKTRRELLMNIFAHVQIPLLFFCKHTYMSSVLGLQRINNGSFTQRNTYTRTHTRHTKPNTCSRVPLSRSQTHRDDLRYRSGPLYFDFHILRYIVSVALWLLFHRWRVRSESLAHPRRRFI